VTATRAVASERAAGRPRALRWLQPSLVTIGVLVLALVPLAIADNLYIQTVAILTLLLVVSSSGWNIISGFAGYVSLGQGAFIGVGAYTVGILSKHWEVPPFLLAPLGGVTAAVLAAILGLVAMRARGHAFVIITIAFLFLMQTLALNLRSITGGSAGITLPLPTWSRDLGELPFYYAMLALAILSVALAAWVRRSKLGAGLLAIREDEGKAAAIGIRTPAYKLIGFVVSAVLIGIAGGIYGYFLTFIDPRGMFDILISVQIVLAALLGGRGTIWGPVLGAFLLQPLNEVVNNYFGTRLGIRLLVFGGLLAAVVMVMPSGIIPTVRTAWRNWRERGSTVPFIEQPVRRPAAAPPPEPAGLGAPAEAARDGQAEGEPAEPRVRVGSAEATGNGQAEVAPGQPAAEPVGAGGPAGEAPVEEAAPPAAVPASLRISEPEGQPAGEAPRPLLDIQRLSKRFGGLTALDDCSFSVREGSITGLIGPNGSGKTTVFNLVSGTVPGGAGQVHFGDRRIDRLRPWERPGLGIGRTFQITRLFKQLTVLENVAAPLGHFSLRGLAAGGTSGPEAVRARELLDLVGLGQFGDRTAGTLSFGQQKLVELAQVLMLEPKLILLDEPAGGVNPSLIDHLAELIRTLNRSGISFLVVEHNMPLVLELCDPVVVLAAGRCIAQGPPKQIQRDPEVLGAYLGGDGHATQRLEV
jgi:ABC-type branched-subunit amino acid transport system ATPase component/ABC-type branched-subunit amino acid transport system permease subunit